ncbi:HNH endonuclease signature motif containing protein [Priestia megaterium]|uniref:HNH endonuclease signature motif containing protein n=1 Tax=Priestia megaterium TaxID=1404 RepID=UPI002E1B6166|nr:HNH endonuclease signature motif containing protein [Priestia megaterium]
MAGYGRFSKITDEDFSKAIESSEFMVDVLEKLGYNRTSGTMTKYIKKRIESLGLDTSHFKGQRGNRGGGNTQRYTLEEILVKNSSYLNRSRLKIRLLNAGYIKEECAECGIGATWNGKPLSLHLDHINGIYNDNELTNLRLLCPNCHSQTETFSGRNSK